MHGPHSGRRLFDRPWAADNGCFTGQTSDEKWLKWLDDLPRSGCLFAVLPDVVGDAVATRKRSLPWIQPVKAMGFLTAYVAQDGFQENDVPWNQIDVLFIGGSTRWKLAAGGASAAAALQRGKRVHMGRVNSYKRLRLAAAIGCASVDGTYLAFGPDKNSPSLAGWISKLQRNAFLPFYADTDQ
tara:strand:- start:205 stop:756 length:552 start_codon:yes stop_codon:yes gene_type:complete